MSWEEMSRKRIKCPCGRGTISQASYMDDWNRWEDGPIEVECDFCRANYDVEGEHHNGMLMSDGTGTIYYLTPKGYPHYSGIRVEDVYPESYRLYDIPFEEFLIKNYTFRDLNFSYAEMKRVGAVSRLNGVSRRICNDHRRKFDSAKIKDIIPKIQWAIRNYARYPDNRENRDIVAAKERMEYQEYFAEKRKHQIRIDI